MTKILMLTLVLALAGCQTDGSTDTAATTGPSLAADLRECSATVKTTITTETNNAIIQYVLYGKQGDYNKLKAAGKIDDRFLECLTGKGYLTRQ
jgi:uncharacterized lipoprotein YajG